MNKLVEFALKQRILMVMVLAVVIVAGGIAFKQLNIEAYPDPVPPLVDINTQVPGMSAEEVERYITIPIETQMAGIPNVKAIRTLSLFGLSDVKLQFTYDFTYHEAEQWVINRLSQLSGLPNGASPQLSPWSPIGEIVRYRLVGPAGYSVTDLKTIQDWILERRFKAVPGVVDVTGWGGKTKTYEVMVDLNKLAAYKLTLPQVLTALNNGNSNVGGQTIDFGAQTAVVRGVGLIHTMDDVRNTVLTVSNGLPVVVGDVATVEVGHEPRLGIAGMNDDNDIVQGIVLMRRGEQSTPTIQRVNDEIHKINNSNLLPPGVHIERIYDRSTLIKLTTHTVLHNMLFGIILIFIVQWLFLGNLRSAIIVASTIPFAFAFAIGIMILRGESANLLSIGAVDFGLIVDAAVIMVENIFRHLAQRPREVRQDFANLHLGTGALSKIAVIGNSATEVNKAIFFAATIIIVGFLPLFTMTGIEGHIFGPMAKTYAYAISGGLIATFTIVPALSYLLLPDHVNETETFIVRALHHAYQRVIRFALANSILVIGAILVLLTVAFFTIRGLGQEFLPTLEEGNLWLRATMPQSVSREASNHFVNEIRRLVKSYPEVDLVVSQHGRPDDGTDSAGFFNGEFFAPLKPADEWPKGETKEQLIERMTKDLEAKFPGIDFNFSQYIQDNVSEAASGVKGANAVKIFGSDLETLEKTAYKVRDVLKTIPGVEDLSVYYALGQPTVNITVDRSRAARYGLSTGDINSTIQAAIGGQAAGNLYEHGSDRYFPMVVRLAPEYRKSLDAISHITIGAPNPNGGDPIQIPLTEVANIELVSGASYIYRENQQRFVPIKFSVRGRDLGSVVKEAQEKVAKEVKLPAGYSMEWVGEFSNLKDAMDRLEIVVPVTLVLILVLLFFNFSSVTDTFLAASVMPMAVVGGIFSLYLTGTPFSVSAAIGFIALFGIAVMDGILVLSYFNQLLAGGMERTEALVSACETRMRPVVMTCIAASVGLLPAALSTGIGSQVQRPLALVVVGGMTLTPILVLIVLPVLIQMFSRRTSANETLLTDKPAGG